MGTSRCEAAVPSLGFSRSPRPLVDATRTAALFAKKPKPILPARGFQGLGGLCRKDNSSQSFGGRLLVASRCHDRHEVRTVPQPGSGIWTGFPFACEWCLLFNFFPTDTDQRLIRASPKA
jgi:hypothetical protein